MCMWTNRVEGFESSVDVPRDELLAIRLGQSLRQELKFWDSTGAGKWAHPLNTEVERVSAFLLLCIFPLSIATFAAGWQKHVTRYLVDSRVHLAVFGRASETAGELCWHDTVTGENGEAAFVRKGSRLIVRVAGGARAEAHVLPDLAIVLRNPPWDRKATRPALGVAPD